MSALLHGKSPAPGAPIGCAGDVVPPYEPLTERQAKGLLRLGDVVIPGDGDLPSFSASGCAEGINRMLPFMYPADESSFRGLLDACAYLPKAAIKGICAAASKSASAPEPLAAALRMANFGIKGVILSLYWSNLGTVDVCSKVGYNPKMNVEAYEASLAEQRNEATDGESEVTA